MAEYQRDKPSTLRPEKRSRDSRIGCLEREADAFTLRAGPSRVVTFFQDVLYVPRSADDNLADAA